MKGIGMIRGRVKKPVTAVLAVILSSVMFFSSPLSLGVIAEGTKDSKSTMAELEASIKEKETAIASAKSERNSLTTGKTNVEKIKKELETSKNNLSEYVTQLDGQVAEIETKIEGLNTQIETKTKEIETTKAELAEAISIRDEQYENMKKRVQAIYEQGEGFYFEILMNSNGLADLLNQVDYIEDLSKYDDKLFKTYAETVSYVTLCEQQLEEEEALLKETKAAAEEEQKALEELISEKQTEIAAVTEEIQDKERAIREYEAEIAEQNATISELEKIVAAEKATLTNMRVYDGGAFCWPAPSYTRISSEYGYRIHPTLGVEMFHNGVDMAAPGGTNILAAYDGTVVSASYTGAMGNYVMIDHGGGLYTIYMHASKLLVSQGQDVKRGDVIALVGTTGRSTGNHLHFSVRLNGQYVSPWNYLVKP